MSTNTLSRRRLLYSDSGLSDGQRRFYAGVLKGELIMVESPAVGEFIVRYNGGWWSRKTTCDDQGFVNMDCYIFRMSSGDLSQIIRYTVGTDPLFSHDFSERYLVQFDFMEALRAL